MRYIFSVAIFLISFLSISQANALQYAAWKSVYRSVPGTSQLSIVDENTHMCTLVRVKMRDIGGNNEAAQCNLRRLNGSWVVQAIISSQADDAFASCKAVCYRY